MTDMNKIRCYKELCRLKTFEDRYEYLRLACLIGDETFGFERYMNQMLYTSSKWRETRNRVIIRDNGCDLGVADRPIIGKIIVHHINPMTVEDVKTVSDDIFNPEYLICVSQTTHNAIHYGDASLLAQEPIERKPGDTCLWK